MEATINNYCDPERKVTAHVDHPDHKFGERFLGYKDLETVFVPEHTTYEKQTVGKYQFDYSLYVVSGMIKSLGLA